MIGTSVPKIFLKSRTQIREHDFIRIFSINKPELIKSYSRKEEESQKAELQTEGDVMKAKTIQLRTSPKVLHATRLEESTEGIREIDWIRLPATY